MLRFLDPTLLLALPALLGLVVLGGRRARTGLGPLRTRLALGLRALVVVCLGLALAEPLWHGFPGDVRVAFVVDRSRSVPQDRLATADQVVLAAQGHMGRAAAGVVVAAGREAAVEATFDAHRPLTLAWASAIDRDGTDLEAGIEAALRAIGEGRGRIVVLSDGLETRGEALRAAMRARGAGVPVEAVHLEWALAADLRVEKIGVPAQARPGEPFEARVIVDATHAAPAAVTLLRDGALIERREVELVAGPNAIPFQLALPAAGLARLEARVEPLRPGDDERPHDDRAFAFVVAPGERRVVHLVAEPADPIHLPFREGLESEGIRVVAQGASEAPIDVAGWEGVDAVILHDLPRTAFSEAQIAAMAAAVSDLGVGLIAIGGSDAYAAGDWVGTPIEEALPVRLLPEDPTVMPETALVLVVDRSGSMAGEKLEMAKRAALLSARQLGPQDQIGIVAFSSEAEWVVKLGLARTRALGPLEQLGDGGGTVILPGLQMARSALRGCSSAVRHVILLTDGRSEGEQGDLITECRRLWEEKATVSTVAVGHDADIPLLRRMAAHGGGKALTVDDPKQLPQVFLHEVQRIARALLEHQTFVPEVRDAAYLEGVGEVPALNGRVRLAAAKPRAGVALTAPDGEPVLAHWQFGLGRSVAFASDVRAPWGAEWVRWEDNRKLWAQLVRWVARDLEGEGVTASVHRQGDEGLVVVEALDAEGEPISDRAFSARVRGPGGGTIEVALRPAGAGRFEGAFPAGEPGVHTVSVRSSQGDRRERVEAVTGLVTPLSEEMTAARSDPGRLAELARAGGGGRHRPDDLLDGRFDPWDTTGLAPRAGALPLAPILLALACGLFLLDVAVRRIAIDVAALFARGPAPAAPARVAAASLPGFPAGPGPTAPVSSAPTPPSPSPPVAPQAEPSPDAQQSVASRLLEAKLRRKQGG